MDSYTFFQDLLHAEHEDDVLTVLRNSGLSIDDDTNWIPLGQNPGNFSVVGNQADNAPAAFIEKVVNSIDAVLMGECHRQNIDPESPSAPASMQDAVRTFFDVRGGRLDNLTPTEQAKLAERIHVVATGDKKSPSYCIVDSGEGQTPDRFPDTFLSTSRSSPKIRIDFVQGKFNAGGSGSLQFSGQHNLQLIASRRQPYALPADDASATLWGFTIVRRRRPRRGERSSVFVYLAPNGRVLRFQRAGINVLPGSSRKNEPPTPYASSLEHGTIVKLYNYKWVSRGIATLEARRQLERVLHTPCLPFRISETRAYRANYYATTVAGVWNNVRTGAGDGDESRTMEPGFPAAATISLRTIGNLPIRIGVWKSTVQTRHYPTGVFFLVNGQAHGHFAADFISRRLRFDYIRNHILVGVDCTNIDRGVAEDLFMASRDRLRKNEHYDAIRDVLTQELSNHQGLKDLNAARRKAQVDKAGDPSSQITDMIGALIRKDPGLANLFGLGQNIVTAVGPGLGEPFNGRKFPTYFRLAKRPKKGLLRKPCPLNRTAKIEFETDAENEYFDRASVPGAISMDPGVDLIEASNLWNGTFTVRFRVPWDAKPGEVTKVRFAVTDVERTVRGPFVSEFELVAASAIEDHKPTHPGENHPEQSVAPGSRQRKVNPALSLPQITPVKKSDWSSENGIESPYDAFRIKSQPGGGYDFFVNDDCAWLLTELSNKANDPVQVKHWFTWGLALSALGMLRQGKDSADATGPDLDSVGQACDGLARVIIPMFRVLYRGPPE